EHRQVGRRVDGRGLVVHVAPAHLIAVRKVVVDRNQPVVGVRIVRRRDRQNAQRNRDTVHSRRLRRRRRRIQVLFQDREVRLRDDRAGHGGERGISVRRRRKHRTGGRGRFASRVVLIHAVVEQLVFFFWSPDTA